MKYIDYDKDYIDSNNSLNFFMHKRKSFEHEREIRALVAKGPEYKNRIGNRIYINVGENNYDYSKEKIIGGVNISVNVEKLIENIFVAPTAPVWFADLVKRVVSKYDFSITVIHSKLYSDPLY